VGILQFDVLEYRITHEYGVDIRLERLPFNIARWVEGSIGSFARKKGSNGGFLLPFEP
jgi:peptide subunit release factor RF-3